MIPNLARRGKRNKCTSARDRRTAHRQTHRPPYVIVLQSHTRARDDAVARPISAGISQNKASDRVIEWKAPLARGIALGARVSAKLLHLLGRTRALRTPPSQARGRHGAWFTLALPVPSHECQHFRSRSPLVGGGRIGCRLTINGRLPLIPARPPQEFFWCRCRDCHFEAVKRTTCDPWVEPIDRDKRARSCGCASCIRCPQGTSATCSRRSASCATIFFIANGCRHQR